MNIKELTDRANDTLNEFGFLKSGLTWNRDLGGIVEVIDIQVSKSSSEATINCGVFHKEVYSLVWGKEWVGVAEEQFCIVRARIGELMDGHDIWWQVSDSQVEQSFVRALTEFCIPFLEGFRSNQEIEAHLNEIAIVQQHPLPKIYLAAVKAINGNRKEGCSLLLDVQKKALGAWRARASDVALRLGCE